MKKQYHILMRLFCIILPVFVQAELCLIDQIECVVCGPERNTPFVNTDAFWKKNLDNQPVRLDQQIQQEIIKQQVTSEKMPLDAGAADKYVESLKKQNNLNDSDLADLFDQIGRTFAEGIDVLNSQYIYEMFMHYKFKSQLVATDDAIKEFYESNPEWLDGWCEIVMGSIPFDTTDNDSKQKALDAAKDIIAGKKDVEWSSPALLHQQEIAKDKQFIFDMDIGQINIHEMADTLELYKMIKKEQRRLKTLEERRFSIIDQLNYKKLESLFDAYNKEVRKFVDIINLNEQVKIEE